MGQVYAQRSHPRPIRRKRSPLHPAGRRRTDKRYTPQQEWILVGQVPAIVSPAQFEQVQAKMKRNQQYARRNNKAHTYLLRALVSCGLCRRTFRGQTRRRYAYYQCAGKDHAVLSGQPDRCPSRLVPMRQLDELVWADVCQVLQDPQVVTQALQRAQAGEWLPQELQARRTTLRRAQQTVHNQIDRLTDAYLAAVVSLPEYQRRRQDLQQRLDAFQQQEQALSHQVDRQADIAGWATHLQTFCQRLQTGLASASFQEKRQLVELLIDRVIVTNDDVEIRYVFPTSPRSEHIRFCLLRLDYCRALPAHVKRRMLEQVSAPHSHRSQ
jgi:site-specific DNA recombinase